MNTANARKCGTGLLGPRRLLNRAGGGALSLEQLENRSMFAADPITGNNPLWTAINGSAKIDGNIKSAEWAGAAVIERAQAHIDGSSIMLRAKYGERGLMLAIDVRDTRLWSDGGGGGSGDRWEYWKDDSIALFFDPKNTRAKNLPASGRMLAFNLGNMASPLSGSGRVLRWDFLKGNGKGGANLATPDATLTPGIKWATRLNGTVNNNSDVDVGWTTEVLIPWAALGLAGQPANGATIGMNFDMSFDNDGGERVIDYVGQSPEPEKRLGDRVVDDHLIGVYGSANMSNGGWKGPVNYAYLQFVNRASSDAPMAIANLTASDVSGYGARLKFASPAASQAGSGHVTSYDIRRSLAPIESEEDWANATVVENDFVPHLRGLAENLRIGELEPATQYYVGVRAVDFAGHEGVTAQVSFTTLGEEQDVSGGERIIVSPNGNMLMTESGLPFVMVGGTVGVSSLYARGLYSGLLWSGGTGGFIDFSQRQDEGTPDGYFDSLTDYGVNTLRVQLERVTLENTTEARSMLPEGMAWLEWREPGDTQSTFNENMKDYLHGMMAEAARTGVHFILQTFNNFNYSSNLELTPFSTVNGGPISTMTEFFWNPQVLEMCKTRLDVLADWVRESPYAYTVMGFELVNEWDGGARTRDEVTEMRQRSRFMIELADHVHQYAPEINVMSTTIGLSPEGPVARAVYYSDAFDVLDPHFYTPSTSEPVNNPDEDKSVRPGMDYGQLATYWLTNRRDNRPVQNAEWDLVGRKWSNGVPYYTGYSEDADPAHPYTLAQDEAIYRTASWVSIASGLAGSGLRIGGSELRDTYPDVFDPETTGYLPVPLSIGMRRVQQSISSFVSGEGSSIEFDWANYRMHTLSGRLGFVNAGGHTLKAWGSTDGDQGLAYVLNDTGKSDGAVSGTTLNIESLTAGATYNFEFWSTGANAHVVGSIGGVVAGTRFTSVLLPNFGADVLVKFALAA